MNATDITTRQLGLVTDAMLYTNYCAKELAHANMRLVLLTSTESTYPYHREAALKNIKQAQHYAGQLQNFLRHLSDQLSEGEATFISRGDL